MRKEEIVAKQEKVENVKSPPAETPPAPKPAAQVVPWVLFALVVVALAGFGFLVGRMFGTRGHAQTVAAAEPAQTSEPPQSAEEGPFYDLDPVIANLNEPGVTRYVRVALTLELNTAAAGKERAASLEQKKPLMTHWLTLYLANQTLEDIRGEKNLLRMQTQISDGLNQTLFPGSKPQIKRILFKEFAIQ
jgi:flagellar FliL protein